jgi:hypothetical protein
MIAQRVLSDDWDLPNHLSVAAAKGAPANVGGGFTCGVEEALKAVAGPWVLADHRHRP